MKKILFAAVFVLLTGSMAFGVNIACSGPVPANPLAMGSTFACGPLNYQVVFINDFGGAIGSTISFDNTFNPPQGSWFDGLDAHVGLVLSGLNTFNGVGDIQFEYLVTGPQAGIDLDFTAGVNTGGNIT